LNPEIPTVLIIALSMPLNNCQLDVIKAGKKEALRSRKWLRQWGIYVM